MRTVMASKECCREAKVAFSRILVLAECNEEDVELVSTFFQVAEKRLPTEAAIERDRKKRLKDRKEDPREKKPVLSR